MYLQRCRHRTTATVCWYNWNVTDHFCGYREKDEQSWGARAARQAYAVCSECGSCGPVHRHENYLKMLLRLKEGKRMHEGQTLICWQGLRREHSAIRNKPNNTDKPMRLYQSPFQTIAFKVKQKSGEGRSGQLHPIYHRLAWPELPGSQSKTFKQCMPTQNCLLLPRKIVFFLQYFLSLPRRAFLLRLWKLIPFREIPFHQYSSPALGWHLQAGPEVTCWTQLKKPWVGFVSTTANLWLFAAARWLLQIIADVPTNAGSSPGLSEPWGCPGYLWWPLNTFRKRIKCSYHWVLPCDARRQN